MDFPKYCDDVSMIQPNVDGEFEIQECCHDWASDGGHNALDDLLGQNLDALNLSNLSAPEVTAQPDNEVSELRKLLSSAGIGPIQRATELADAFVNVHFFSTKKLMLYHKKGKLTDKLRSLHSSCDDVCTSVKQSKNILQDDDIDMLEEYYRLQESLKSDQSEMDTVQSQVKILQAQLFDINSQHGLEIASIRSKHKWDIKLLESNLDKHQALVTYLESQIVDLNQQLQSLIRTHKEQLDESISLHGKEVERLESELVHLKVSLQQLDSDSSVQLNTLQSLNNELKAKLKLKTLWGKVERGVLSSALTRSKQLRKKQEMEFNTQLGKLRVIVRKYQHEFGINNCESFGLSGPLSQDANNPQIGNVFELLNSKFEADQFHVAVDHENGMINVVPALEINASPDENDDMVNCNISRSDVHITHENGAGAISAGDLICLEGMERLEQQSEEIRRLSEEIAHLQQQLHAQALAHKSEKQSLESKLLHAQQTGRHGEDVKSNTRTVMSPLISPQQSPRTPRTPRTPKTPTRAPADFDVGSEDIPSLVQRIVDLEAVIARNTSVLSHTIPSNSQLTQEVLILENKVSATEARASMVLAERDAILTELGILETRLLETASAKQFVDETLATTLVHVQSLERQLRETSEETRNLYGDLKKLEEDLLVKSTEVKDINLQLLRHTASIDQFKAAALLSIQEQEELNYKIDRLKNQLALSQRSEEDARLELATLHQHVEYISGQSQKVIQQQQLEMEMLRSEFAEQCTMSTRMAEELAFFRENNHWLQSSLAEMKEQFAEASTSASTMLQECLGLRAQLEFETIDNSAKCVELQSIISQLESELSRLRIPACSPSLRSGYEDATTQTVTHPSFCSVYVHSQTEDDVQLVKIPSNISLTSEAPVNTDATTQTDENVEVTEILKLAGMVVELEAQNNRTIVTFEIEKSSLRSKINELERLLSQSDNAFNFDLEADECVAEGEDMRLFSIGPLVEVGSNSCKDISTAQLVELFCRSCCYDAQSVKSLLQLSQSANMLAQSLLCALLVASNVNISFICINCGVAASKNNSSSKILEFANTFYSRCQQFMHDCENLLISGDFDGRISAMDCVVGATNLGILLLTGKLVDRDSVRAVRIFELACKQSVPVDSLHSALDADETATLLSSPFNRTEYRIAETYLGMCLFSGVGELAHDPELALKHLMTGAGGGFALAQQCLGYYFDRVQRQSKRAVEFYLMAAEQGCVEAQVCLAMMFEFGRSHQRNDGELETEIGVSESTLSVDYEQALKWYKLAADPAAGNSKEAQFNLGLLYARGYGVSQDQAKAAELYKLAANQGLADACYNLGICYLNGIGVKKNMREGLWWLRRVQENEDA